MASAAITVNGNAVTDAVAVLRGTTVTLALVSLDGVAAASYSIIGVSESGLSVPTVTPTGSPATSATFTIGDRANQALLIQTTVTAADGSLVRSYTVVGVVDELGRIPLVPDEETARGTRGWADAVNSWFRPLYSARITTTNNTDTDVLTIPIAVNEVMELEVRWRGRDQSNSDLLVKTVNVAAKRNGSGSAALIGSAFAIRDASDDGTWTATVVASGNNLIVRAKGDATNSVLWDVSARPFITR